MSLSQDLMILATKLAEVEAQLGDVPAALEAAKEEGRRSRDQEFTDLVAAKDAEKAAFGEAEFQRGVASVVCPDPGSGDKIFSQAEVDAMLAPLNEQVVAMRGQIESLESQVAGMDQKISEAVQAKVAEFKAKLDEVEAQF